MTIARFIKPLGLVLSPVFLLVVCLATRAPAQSIFSGFEGQLIVASPRMADPRFANSVVFIFAHEVSGALGLIVNQRAVQVPLAELYRLAQVDESDLEDGDENGSNEVQVPLHVGGPVEPGAGNVLHEAETATEQSLVIDEAFAVSSWDDFLRRAAKKGLPERAIFTLGLASWGPGQLEMEVIQGAWISQAAEPDLIFDGDPDQMWDRITKNPESSL
ncbi:MAG: YqgE/AlgH family protein [Alphaproteobacteria bacterium]|nr:YqgE/AlgH family protein [Alphaproteobacteria bacterium]